MRRLLFFLFFFAFLLASAQATYLEIALLGTGTPIPDVKRFGPATVVEANGRYFIFDTGRGVTMRLQQAGIPLNKIEQVFLTHLHSDHVSGLADLWLTGWIWQRENNLTVYGPIGVKQLTTHTQKAHEADIKYRSEHASLRLDTVTIKNKEITGDGVIYEANGVRVIAFSVDHGPVKPAYGYRLEYGDRSIVISGDTRYSENLIKHAQNADVIIHEIAAAKPALLNQYPGLKNIMAYHTNPEQLVKVLQNTKPRLALLTHVLLYGVSEAQVLDRIRQGYSGNLHMSKDLLTIGVGDTIRINQPR